MFSSIKDALARRKFRRSALGQYMTEEAFDDYWQHKDEPLLPKTRELSVVLIQFHANDDATLQAMLSSVVELASAHHGVVDVIVSHLVVVCFGMLDSSSCDGSSSFIEALIENFGKQARVCFARGAGLVGNFGGTRQMAYTFIHPAFPTALAELVALKWGEVHEVQQPDAVLSAAQQRRGF